jgi:hypothetical protein
MGRGRAKAKQIKVARKLKYSAPSTDLSALERELRASRGDFDDHSVPVPDEEPEEDVADDDDPYAAYAVEDDDQDDYGSWATGSSR